MLAACSTSSSSASAPDTVRNAIGDLASRAVDCSRPPAGTDLCWDGSKPLPADPARPHLVRCPARVTFPEGKPLSMEAFAQRALQLAAWALEEQAKRIARSDWDAACAAARG